MMLIIIVCPGSVSVYMSGYLSRLQFEAQSVKLFLLFCFLISQDFAAALGGPAFIKQLISLKFCIYVYNEISSESIMCRAGKGAGTAW